MSRSFEKPVGSPMDGRGSSPEIRHNPMGIRAQDSGPLLGNLKDAGSQYTSAIRGRDPNQTCPGSICETHTDRREKNDAVIPEPRRLGTPPWRGPPRFHTGLVHLPGTYQVAGTSQCHPGPLTRDGSKSHRSHPRTGTSDNIRRDGGDQRTIG